MLRNVSPNYEKQKSQEKDFCLLMAVRANFQLTGDCRHYR
jgi:hypothetical protein